MDSHAMIGTMFASAFAVGSWHLTKTKSAFAANCREEEVVVVVVTAGAAAGAGKQEWRCSARIEV